MPIVVILVVPLVGSFLLDHVKRVSLGSLHLLFIVMTVLFVRVLVNA